MFEQLVNELVILWVACTTYPYSVTVTVTLAISVTLTGVFGYKYWDFKEENNSLHVAILRGLFLNQDLIEENSKLREKLKKYQKLKTPLINTKHGIRSKLNEVK